MEFLKKILILSVAFSVEAIADCNATRLNSSQIANALRGHIICAIPNSSGPAKDNGPWKERHNSASIGDSTGTIDEMHGPAESPELDIGTWTINNDIVNYSYKGNANFNYNYSLHGNESSFSYCTNGVEIATAVVCN